MKLRLENALCCLIFLILAALPFTLARAHSEAHDPQEEILEKVGVDEKPGASIPRELQFNDQRGKGVQLASYFTGGPVIVTLNYYSCPTLCPIIFRNLATTIGKLGTVSLGRDFKVVAVSLDPAETQQRAAERAATTYGMLPDVADPGGAWPFLWGSQSSIERLAGALGVRFARAPNGEIAHPNVVVIATPDGRISRYLYGMELAPQDLRLALIEASGGEIGSSSVVNRALLYCFHYDPVGKKYVLLASRVMSAVMVGVLLLTLTLLAMLWKREKPGT